MDDIRYKYLNEYNKIHTDRKLVYSDYRAVPSNFDSVGTEHPTYGTVKEVGKDEHKKKVYEIINDLKGNANAEFDNLWKKALDNNENVIIDMTNIDKYARKQWINRFSYYYKTAVDFKFDNDKIGKILINAQNRARNTGKVVYDSCIIDFVNKYEPPTIEEGFDKIEETPAFNAATETD